MRLLRNVSDLYCYDCTITLISCIASTPNRSDDDSDDDEEQTPGTYQNPVECEVDNYMT